MIAIDLFLLQNAGRRTAAAVTSASAGYLADVATIIAAACVLKQDGIGEIGRVFYCWQSIDA